VVIDALKSDLIMKVLLFFDYKSTRWAVGGPHGVAKRLIFWAHKCKKEKERLILKMIELPSILLYFLSALDYVINRYANLIPGVVHATYELLMLKLRLRVCVSFIRKNKELFYEADIIQIHNSSSFVCLFQVLPELFKTKPIILAHHAPGAYATYIARQFPKISNSKFLDEYRRLENFSFKHADFIIVPSQGTLRLLVNDLPRVSFEGKKIYVIHNGIVQLKGAKGRLRHMLSIGDDIFLVGSVGKLIKDKGMDILIKAMQLLKTKYGVKNIHLVIRGYGSEYQHLKDYARKLRVNDIIHFVPYIKKIGDLYADLDLFVMATRRAAFDLVILEALSAGLPIIVSDLDSNIEAISSAGLIFKSEDVEALAKLIFEVYSNNKLRVLLRRKALELFRDEYSLDSMGNNYLKCYKEILRYYTS
jgi:glycosyltransferase involved in cell wall biosynthesis